jgi:ParB family transcriptional regulator, chromosome partitioning protein
MPNNGLGRGLGSLIPQKQQKPATANTDLPSKSESGNQNTGVEKSTENALYEIDPEKISVNPFQPRTSFTDSNLDELVESIKRNGVIQPLVVTEKKDGSFELVAGERRLRASKQAGLKKVPVIVKKINDKKKLEFALIENLQREDLNPIDTAVAYKKLMEDFDMTQEEVADQMGKSRSSVANIIRMLNLPEEIRLALIDGRITQGHAKYLLGLDSEAKQMSLFRKIIHNELSVSDTNKESRRMGGTKSSRIKINYKDKDKEFAFREFFGAKTEIKRKGKGGQILLEFYSDDELNEMVKKIKGDNL